MSKFYTQDQKDAWQREALRRRGRSAQPVSMEEADRMLADSAGGSGQAGGKVDRLIRLLESIDRKLDRLGTIG